MMPDMTTGMRDCREASVRLGASGALWTRMRSAYLHDQVGSECSHAGDSNARLCGAECGADRCVLSAPAVSFVACMDRGVCTSEDHGECNASLHSNGVSYGYG